MHLLCRINIALIKTILCTLLRLCGLVHFESEVPRRFWQKDIQVLHNAMGEGVKFPGKKRYQDVRFNVLALHLQEGGWVGVKFPENTCAWLLGYTFASYLFCCYYAAHHSSGHNL